MTPRRIAAIAARAVAATSRSLSVLWPVARVPVPVPVAVAVEHGAWRGVRHRVARASALRPGRSVRQGSGVRPGSSVRSGGLCLGRGVRPGGDGYLVEQVDELL